MFLLLKEDFLRRKWIKAICRKDFDPSKYSKMTTDDELEFVQMHIWRQAIRIKVFFLHNPPSNNPDFDSILLNWNSKCRIGDFNAPSTRWGYMATFFIDSIA
ncbi:hypothetical protein TNIN_398581 [Trichonephila inaurata madagascariensis]|uniref:Uncharacterized protein n=1 Tax=Trichonephila inaurata madagascariensis TaxID=2747483 RepID=A0A8X6I362_9ARAC|nr:hypothetical protein TNIN_398581 [Trichonephila inaurata madagascariensis]